MDGHNRYKIAEEHDLPYRTEPREFKDRDEATIWIIENQLGRRNLVAYDRVLLEDRKRDVLQKIAKEKVSSGGGDRKSDEYKKSANEKSCYPIDSKEKNKINRQNTTDYKIADAAGVSEDTVRKVRNIEKYATPEVRNNYKTE